MMGLLTFCTIVMGQHGYLPKAASVDQREQQDRLDQPEAQEPRGEQELPVQQGLVAQRGQQGRRELQEPPGQLELPAQPEPQEQLDRQEVREQQEARVKPVPLALPGRPEEQE